MAASGKELQTAHQPATPAQPGLGMVAPNATQPESQIPRTSTQSDSLTQLGALLFQRAQSGMQKEIYDAATRVYSDLCILIARENNDKRREFLNGIATKTMALIEHPNRNDALKDIEGVYHATKRTPWGKILAASLFTLIGAVLVAASVAVAVASFGVFTVPAVFGVLAGVSAVQTAFAAASAAFGVGFLAGAGGLFANSAKVSRLRGDLSALHQAGVSYNNKTVTS